MHFNKRVEATWDYLCVTTRHSAKRSTKCFIRTFVPKREINANHTFDDQRTVRTHSQIHINIFVCVHRHRHLSVCVRGMCVSVSDWQLDFFKFF